MKAQRLLIPIAISLTMLIFFLIMMPVNALTGLATSIHADGTQPDAIGHDTSEDERSVKLTMERPSVLDVMMQNNYPVINGDFEAGNTGFSSDYTYGDLGSPGHYVVLTDPHSAHGGAESFGDHTSGSGLMMAVNGATSANQVVWSQSIEVFPNTDYEFSAWVASWTSLSPAQLRFRINGDAIGTFTAPTTTGVWQQFTAFWNSASDTIAEIEIVDLNTAFSGNDFALDDLSLAPPLLDRMIWNALSECPVCSASSAVGWTGGPINTRNGNLSYQETDLVIPVRGESLAFRRSYASQAATIYTTTLGYGWTHNYDMRLHFSGTLLTDTVELQTPGGSRLPFYDNGDDTYTPYAGVTAQLTYDGVNEEFTVTGFNQATYIFNSQGQLIEQIDPFGNSIYFSYDNGLLSQAEQGNRALIYTYDNNDRLLEVEDSISRTVTLGYSPVGDLMTVTLAAPDASLILTTTYQYSGTTHLLTHVIDPSGRVVEQTAYDNQGRAYRQWDGLGNLLVEIDYSLSNTHVITASGVVMTHTYTLRGTLADVTYGCAVNTPGCGAGRDMAYDYHFKTRQTVDPNGNTTGLKWSGGGSNLEQVRDALEQDTFFTYDNLNSLTEVENARGYTTSYSYEDGNLPTFRTSSTDALQQTTIYTPTAEGLLAAEEDPNGLVTHYWYNVYGQVTQTVRAYGTSEAITMTYGYDAVGRLITTTQVSPDSDSITSLSVYDAANRLIATIQNWTGTNPVTWENECLTTFGPRDTNVCTRYGYDAAGRTISTTNTLGQTDLSFYDAAGRSYLRVGNYDGTANYQNDPVGVLCNWVTPDPENNLCTLTGYDSYGRVVSTTNVLGYVDRTFYDSLGRVQATVVNSVNVTDDWEECDFPPTAADEDLCTVYTYDAAGNVVEVKDPMGRVTLTVYDELNRVEGTVVNWDGLIDLDDCYTSTWLNQTERDENVCTRYVYDEVGNTAIVSDTLGRISFTVYDELNRVAGTIGNWDGAIDLDDCWTGSLPANRDNNVCTGYLYDAAGNQTVVTNTLGQMDLTVYDTAQRPIIQVTNWDGTSTTWPDDCADTTSQPDATENLCTFTNYDSLGRRASVTDVMGHVTEFTYDGLGRVITTTRYLNGQPVETSVAYDALGNRLTQTDGEDHTVTTHYDSLNRPVVTISHEGVAITTTYNAASWITGTVNNLGHTTASGYDALGRLVMMTDGENHATLYQYDALGNQTRITDAEGVKTTYEYDDLNRLVKVTENSFPSLPAYDHDTNVATQYGYDVIGNRLVITHSYEITTALTVYDELNRPISVKDGLGNETQYQYNVLGQRTVMTDANGDITLYSYDDLNRLDTVSYETDNETVEYGYDALGNRTTMTDSLGVATYQYDDFSRVITVTSPLTGTVIYDYDKVGNRVELTYPNGYTVTYQYNGDNQLIEVEDWQEGITTYEYDPVGQLITTTLPNGVVTVNTYDDAHRLTNLTHEDGDSNLVASYTYALDDVGNRVVATETLRLPFQVTTETQTSPTGLSVTGMQLPAVAYNSYDDEYMVIWQGYNEEVSAWYLYGQRVGTSGALLGTDLEIAAEATEPAIAYSPEQNQYLVVWRNADDDIQGLFVDADGSISTDPFTIYDTDTNSQPDVAYNPNDATFTVVWLYENGEKYGINAYKVQEQGTVVEVAGEQVALANPAIAISSSGTQLVAWEMEDTTYALFDIKGQRLNSSGSLLGTVLTLANDANHNETTPAIAWNDSASNFLVTWRDTASSLGDTEYAIEARRVGTDGSLPGSIVTLHSGMGTLAASPDLVVSGDDWLVAWQQNASDRDLYGRWVQSNGTLGDETLALITAASNQAHPALAEGSDAGGMLLVWGDDRNSEDAIYHAVLIPSHLETTVIDYTYDPLYRLVEADYSGNLTANYQYVYDAMGNRTMFTRTITSTLVTTYTYNAANQLVTAKLNTSATTWYYEFDARGNQVRQVPNGLPPAAGEIRYTFNQANQLIRIEKHNGTTYQTQATALYDGDGYRRQTEAYLAGIPFTNTYAVDVLRDGLPLTVQNSLMTTHVLYGLYGIGEYQDNNWLYYQGDGSMSVRQMTDGDGQIVLAQTYAPYGSLLQLAGDGEAIFGFAGSQAGGLNLLYGGQRYFDPETGRYLTPDYSNFDPKHPSRGLNPYTSVLILAPLFIAIGLRKRKGGKIQWYIWLLLGTSLVFTLTACRDEGQGTPTSTPPNSDGTGTPDASEIETPIPESSSVDPNTLPTPGQTIISEPPLTPAIPTSTPTCTPTPTATSSSEQVNYIFISDPLGRAAISQEYYNSLVDSNGGNAPSLEQVIAITYANEFNTVHEDSVPADVLKEVMSRNLYQMFKDVSSDPAVPVPSTEPQSCRTDLYCSDQKLILILWLSTMEGWYRKTDFGALMSNYQAKEGEWDGVATTIVNPSNPDWKLGYSTGNVPLFWGNVDSSTDPNRASVASYQWDQRGLGVWPSGAPTGNPPCTAHSGFYYVAPSEGMWFIVFTPNQSTYSYSSSSQADAAACQE